MPVTRVMPSYGVHCDRPQQVVGVAANRRGRLDLEELPQHRQIVLEVVDRVGRLQRRRPRQPGAPFSCGGLLELLRLGNAPGDRAHDVKRVEARDPRPRLGHFDPRIREPQPLGGRAHRQPQQQALAARAIFL